MKKANCKSDCRNKEGIAIGLIDSIISICRVLAPKIEELSKDELPQNVIEALKDLTDDKDVLTVLRAYSSRYIISDVRAKIFDKIIESAKTDEI